MNIKTIYLITKTVLISSWCKLQPLFNKSLETFFTSLGILLSILLIFCIINYMPQTSFSRPLIKIFAKQIGVSDPYVTEMINNEIKKYSKQYGEQIIEEIMQKKPYSVPTQDEFSTLLAQIYFSQLYRWPIDALIFEINLTQIAS